VGILALAEQMKAINAKLEEMEQESPQKVKKATPALAETISPAPDEKPEKEKITGFLRIF